ncbi:MAG: DUF4136 domain-containing protein [bacterium]|nr:DUF4136 domain-containing protein [bacterium]
MRFRILALLVVLLAAAPALAQKVFIDYDPNYDVSSIKTFAWKSTPETSLEATDQLTHSRIVNAIEHHLSMGGVAEVSADPDIYVTYHVETQDNLTINSTNFGYGYPGGWYRSGYYGHRGSFYAGVGTSTAAVNSYQTGTLIVDAWDADSNEIIWRGIADEIGIVANPAKMEKRIDRALQKIVSKSQKMREKDKKKSGAK